MDDLTKDLKKLGDVVEGSVDAVTVDEVLDRANAHAPVTDIGLASGTTKPAEQARRKLSPRVLAAAAATLVLVIGSVAFFGRTNNSDEVDLASAIQQGQTFTGPDDDNGWGQLRWCESRNTYDIDTGNTFYGAYQFPRSSFRTMATELGLVDYADMNPATVPPFIQDAVANALYLEQGTEPWPVCGRFIKGPMITPLVPQWLQYGARSSAITRLYLKPAVSPDRVSEIGDEIATILVLDNPAELRLVDQQEAFAEFRQQIDWTDPEYDSVSAEDLPARFEIRQALSTEITDQILAISGVHDAVVTNADWLPTSGPLRMTIPAIGLDIPLSATPTTDALATGAAVMLDNPSVVVIAGFRSAPGSVFSQLNDLRDGDIVQLSTLLSSRGGSYEVIRTYAIDRSNASELPLYDIDDMLLWQAAEGPGLTLVADVEGEPTQRFVLRARTSEPDLTRYPAASDD